MIAPAIWSGSAASPAGPWGAATVFTLVLGVAGLSPPRRGCLPEHVPPVPANGRACQPVALDTITDSGTHAHRDRPGDRWPYRVADLGLFQLLDVAATRDPARGQLTVFVVNRDPGQAIQTRVRLYDAKATGVMTVHQVTGDRPDAINTLARPDEVSAHNSKREVEGEHVDITFAPHSFTLSRCPWPEHGPRNSPRP